MQVEGLGDVFITRLKLGGHLLWRQTCKSDPVQLVPMLLHLCVVDAEGSRIKSAEEWDDWGADNLEVGADLFNRCMQLMESGEETEKK